jgi:hypothetical protein
MRTTKELSNARNHKYTTSLIKEQVTDGIAWPQIVTNTAAVNVTLNPLYSKYIIDTSSLVDVTLTLPVTLSVDGLNATLPPNGRVWNVTVNRGAQLFVTKVNSTQVQSATYTGLVSGLTSVVSLDTIATVAGGNTYKVTFTGTLNDDFNWACELVA